MTDHNVPDATVAGATRRARPLAFGAPDTRTGGPTAAIHTFRASLTIGSAEVPA
ncbi:hypothetical protein [Nocardia sp. NBC_01329]|uniref:hypothetical protein n=1 Tax=Nocardia sp. NBC_01329 TaxID=2903594 RepID=UPI002E116A6B|nr:hypothetical protein OG405_21855 [Nocardia sp. NBC_01329]